MHRLYIIVNPLGRLKKP